MPVSFAWFVLKALWEVTIEKAFTSDKDATKHTVAHLELSATVTQSELQYILLLVIFWQLFLYLPPLKNYDLWCLYLQ